MTVGRRCRTRGGRLDRGGDKVRGAAVKTSSMTSREFNQDASGAKRRAREGPVFITDRGRPAHVLLTVEEYRRLTGARMTLAESLAQPEPEADFEVDFPRSTA